MGFAEQRFNVNLSILFTELPLLERPEAAAAAGFTAVELWWPWVDSPTPERSEPDAVKRFTGATRQIASLRGAGSDESYDLYVYPR